MFFPTTRWTVLADASLNGDGEGSRALDDFVRRYRGPILDFIRAQGWPASEIEDLGQEFFVHVMREGTLRRADASRGRFRAFIRGALARFLARARRRASAQKRGSGAPMVSLDAGTLPEDAVAVAPEDAARFDRDWAVRLLELSVGQVEQEFALARRAADFERLRPFLPGGSEPPSYAAGAAGLGLSLAAFKTEVHRLRGRLRAVLRQEVALTIDSPHEVDLEMQYLQSALAGENRIDA